VFKKLKKLD